jgi:hypothetical protein
MTELLERALAELAKLPERDQNAIAAIILEAIEDERRWEESSAPSADVLERLADEARAELRAGRTLPLDPDRL